MDKKNIEINNNAYFADIRKYQLVRRDERSSTGDFML